MRMRWQAQHDDQDSCHQSGHSGDHRGVAVGINVNANLIFSRRRYAEVLEAYLAAFSNSFKVLLAAIEGERKKVMERDGRGVPTTPGRESQAGSLCCAQSKEDLC